MKPISDELKTHLAGEVTTTAYLWKLTRRDGVVLGFTDHDASVVYDGVTYRSQEGFIPSAIESSSALNVDNMDIEGMLSSDAIAQEDVSAGLYDFAEISVSLINYADVSQGTLSLRTGWLGEVLLNDGAFTAEVRGLTQALSQTIGELYSKTCRASLGDARCKVDMAAYTVSGTVQTNATEKGFTDTNRNEQNGYFDYGKITFTSGTNQGVEMEVKEFRGGAFSMSLPLPHALENGDGYSVQAGCDRRVLTCQNRFGNVMNFRGEPHVPGLDTVLETSATRSS